MYGAIGRVKTFRPDRFGINRSTHYLCVPVRNRLRRHTRLLLMTKKLILFLMLFSVGAFAQVKLPANETGQVQYQEIVRIGDGKQPARQVYNQIRSWAQQYYPLGNEAEQQYDQQHGILFVRSLYSIGNQSVRYTLTVEAKIGRYRATVTDLVLDNNGFTQPLRSVSSTAEELSKAASDTLKDRTLPERVAADQAALYQQIDKECRATLASLKEAMTAADEEREK